MQMTPQGSVGFYQAHFTTLCLCDKLILSHTVGLIAECLHTQLFEPQCHVEVFKLCTAKPLRYKLFSYH